MFPYEKCSYELRVWRKKIPKPGGERWNDEGGRTYLYARWLCFLIPFFGRNDSTDFY